MRTTRKPMGAAVLQSKGDATRRRVIEQAAPVLNAKGYAGTAMSDLMAATGLQKGGIYRHFTNKSELALECLRYTIAAAERVKFDALDESADAIDQLRAFVRNFVARRSPVGGGCPILNTSVEHDDGIPAFRREAERCVVRWIERVADIVRRGQAEGTVDRRADAKALGATIIATLEGAVAINGLAPQVGALGQVERFLCESLERLRTRVPASR